MTEPLVSIVIPTKNSGDTLEKCLFSINSQTYPMIEVIVVDDFSIDNTKKIAAKFNVTFMERKAGRSLARNVGVSNSKGSLVLCMDSDMELTPKVIERCVDKINKGWDAIVIPEISVGIGFWAKCTALEKLCYIGDDLIEASRFFKKSVVVSLGGYDSNLETGEDWDMNIRVKKAGYSIGRVNTLIIHNDGRLVFWKMVKKKYRYGKTLKRYERKHPMNSQLQLNLLRPALVKNWKKLLKDPTHALGLIFLKSCEFAAIKLGTLNRKEETL
jgi:glycosyltransferase involved in cell wall biosynthesis